MATATAIRNNSHDNSKAVLCVLSFYDLDLVRRRARRAARGALWPLMTDRARAMRHARYVLRRASVGPAGKGRF